MFLGQNKWFAVRIRQSMIPKLKYLAMYEKNPVKAIRYIGKIKKNGIKLYRNTGKYEIVLEEKAIKIPKIKLPKGNPGLAPQAPRYTMKKLIDIHYLRNDMVLEPGTFRLIGDNFEIFPKLSPKKCCRKTKRKLAAERLSECIHFLSIA